MSLASLSQVDIAFGLLYIGLKEARYRERVYLHAARLLKLLFWFDLASPAYIGILAKNKLVRKHNRIVFSFMRLMPPSYLESTGAAAANYMAPAGDPRLAPRFLLLRFMKTNADNYIVMFISIFLPVMHLWALYAYEGWEIAFLGQHVLVPQIEVPAVILGMVIPAIFAVLGLFMVHSYQKQLSFSVNHIIVTMEQETTAADIDKYSNGD